MDNSIFAGKRVVVLGMGNSAMDIAVESSYVAERTYLAARQGVWIVPKYVFGKPVDQLRNDPRVPFKIRQRMIQQLIRSYAGPPERYGLPKPNHRFGEAHPTVSGRILDRIQHGTIAPKPNIDSFDGSRVRFVDGSTVEADVVVYCTGYKITFPFFDEDLISAPENHIELFRRVFHPDIPNVFFIGLLQPLGAIMPLAEAQGAWVGDYLLGDYALPADAAMRADIGPIRRRCARATWPPSATRSRSISTTTCTRSPASGARAAHARAQTGISHRRHADLLPPQSLHRALPDLQQDAARKLADHGRLLIAREGSRARSRSLGRRGHPAPARARGEGVRIHREGRAEDDGYRSELVPGLRASADALRLVEEIAFSSGRLLALAAEPPGLYGEARALAGEDLERATWMCFLIVYLCPLEGEDPFAGIRAALASAPGELPDLDGIPLGPLHVPRPAARR